MNHSRLSSLHVSRLRFFRITWCLSLMLCPKQTFSLISARDKCNLLVRWAPKLIKFSFIFSVFPLPVSRKSELTRREWSLGRWRRSGWRWCSSAENKKVYELKLYVPFCLNRFAFREKALPVMNMYISNQIYFDEKSSRRLAILSRFLTYIHFLEVTNMPIYNLFGMNFLPGWHRHVQNESWFES